MANMTEKVTMRNPIGFATNSLRYVVKNGKHVVIHYTHCGEDIAPDFYRFTRYSEALVMWNKILSAMIERGYTERVV